MNKIIPVDILRKTCGLTLRLHLIYELSNTVSLTNPLNCKVEQLEQSPAFTRIQIYILLKSFLLNLHQKYGTWITI